MTAARTYLAAARRLREIALALEATAVAQTPQDRRRQSLAVHRLMGAARQLLARHSDAVDARRRALTATRHTRAARPDTGPG